MAGELVRRLAELVKPASTGRAEPAALAGTTAPFQFRGDDWNTSGRPAFSVVVERSAAALLLGLGLLACGMARTGGTPKAPPLPTEAKRWVGAPQSWERLRGRVVLLDVWTFG